MTVALNHTIVWCTDRYRSADFLAGMFGLPEPKDVFHFRMVKAANGVSLDFAEGEGAVAPQHYAFLVSEPEFDAILARIRAKDLQYWADPARRHSGQINHNSGGRGVYFEDPDGHILEALTVPCGE
ncbi:MAG TPA: VOC family protein [Novosphingobium sp.]|nr:VOC family protein [Novosphingobium sp.]